MPRDSWTRVADRVRSPRPPGRRAAPRPARATDGREAGGQPEVHRQRHQVLLGPVVDVALQPAARVVLGVDQPLAGLPQLRLARPTARPPLLELGAQPRAPQHQPGLAGQPGEQPLLDRGQRRARPLPQHQHPELLVRRGGPASRRRARVPARRAGQPRLAPPAARWRPASAGPSTTTQTCAHSAPVPSASTRAIRGGQLLGRVSCRRRRRRTAAARRTARAAALCTTRDGEALEPGQHRVERQRRRRRWPAPRAPRCGDAVCPIRAAAADDDDDVGQHHEADQAGRAPRPATSHSRRGRRRSAASQLIPAVCSLGGRAREGAYPHPGGGAGRTGQPRASRAVSAGRPCAQPDRRRRRDRGLLGHMPLDDPGGHRPQENQQ